MGKEREMERGRRGKIGKSRGGSDRKKRELEVERMNVNIYLINECRHIVHF